MTCEEFERVLPDDARTREQELHLTACSTCSCLVADLDVISQQARLLRDVDEPNPRVWNSIEIALRTEGLIREIPVSANRQPFLVPSRPRRLRLYWPVPAAIAVALVLMLSFAQRERAHHSAALSTNTPVVISQIGSVGAGDDERLLEVVSKRSPAMLASYQANLRDVNSYIHDAEDALKLNPNDEQAQQYLMNAYEQRSMVYEMALDRSLP